MVIIQTGAIASALLAVFTLITKLISLVNAIQALISRIDAMQKDVDLAKGERAYIFKELDHHDKRILFIEHTLDLREDSHDE